MLRFTTLLPGKKSQKSRISASLVDDLEIARPVLTNGQKCSN